VQKLLAEMKRQMMITVVGKTSAARWYPHDKIKPRDARENDGKRSPVKINII
jgi:hypothetical protein